MFVPYENEEDNKKYVKRHEPWVICFQCVKFNAEIKDYELDNSIQYDNYYKNPYFDSAVLDRGKRIVGRDCCEQFVNFALRPEICDTYAHIYAHNASGYDSILILSKMLKIQDKLKINPMFNNGKLLSLRLSTQLNTIEFRDSARIITMPLKDFNENLNLGQNMEKEIQEYEFMCPAVLEKYIQNGGSYATLESLFQNGILKREMYNCSDSDFEVYYEKNKTQDYVQRYINYCHQDVDILCQGMIKFYQMGKKQFNINFFNYLTISSAALNLYLMRAGPDMFEKNIFDLQYNWSIVEKKLVKIISDTPNLFNYLFGTKFNNVQIIGQNERFDKYNVDIVIKADDKKYIVEVDGVYYHGLILNQVEKKSTQIKQSINRYTDEIYEWECNTYQDQIIQTHSCVLEQRLRHHNEKSKFLNEYCKLLGYEKVFHVTDQTVNKFIKDLKLIVKIDLHDEIKNRDVLRGGRTECFVHYMKINTDTHCIRGYDTTSLYPGAMLQNLPLRESQVIKGGDTKFVNDLYEYSLFLRDHNYSSEQLLHKILHRPDKRVGFVKCKILPPKNLLIPSLCVKLCDKLLAPLCRTCAEQLCKDVNQIMNCKHTDEERMLFGYFADVELLHAFCLGYRIYEVYETVVYNKTTFNDPAFHGNDFIKECMFYKSVNSDPKEYNEEVFQILKDQLNFEFKIQEDNKFLIYQDKEQQIIENNAMKNMYKLILNSCYGKLGMNVVNESYSMNPEPENCDTNIYVNVNPLFIGNYVFTRSTANEELQQLNNSQSNHFLAGTVTAIGRTILYFLQQHIIEKYEGKILYSDTDSVYCVVPKKYKSMKGFALKGTLGIKNEIKFNDANEFICLGAKAYAYKNENSDGNDLHNQTAKGLSYDYNIQYKQLNKKQVDELKAKENLTTDEQQMLYQNKRGKVSTLEEAEIGMAETFDLYNAVLAAHLIQKDIQIQVKQENNFIKLKQKGNDYFEIVQDKNMIKQINYNERKRVMVIDENNQIINTLPFGFQQ